MCVKVDEKFDASYVYKLHKAVERHCTIPYNFVCLTDRPEELEGINTIIPGRKLKGWWTKILLFRPMPEQVQILFFDLDTVIIDNIDFLAAYRGPLFMIQDFYFPSSWQTGVFGLRSNSHPEVWEYFESNPDWQTTVRGDAELVQIALNNNKKRPVFAQDLWPGKIVSYKVHCQQGPPPGAAVVCFHGKPMPHEVDHDWVFENWRE